jgi:hypothetical protein
MLKVVSRVLSSEISIVSIVGEPGWNCTDE